MTETTKRSVPTWMKVVIGAVSLLVGLVIGLLIVGGLFLFKANDPAYKKVVAGAIAEFPEPLPGGFTLGAATDLNNLKTILINHKPEQMDISISEADVADPSMKKALDLSFESKADSSTFQQNSEGKITIAGHVMDYREGIRTMGTEKAATLDGRINDIPNKFISITAFSDPDKKFDLKTFQTLTDSIKSITGEHH